MSGRYARPGRPDVLGPALAIGGSLLLLGAVLAILGRLTLLALRGLLYAGLIAVAVLLVAGRELGARWPRRRHLFELLDPVGNCAVNVDRTDWYPCSALADRMAQDEPTIVDDLLTPPTRQDHTMPLTLTADELEPYRLIGTGRRLAALTRLMDAVPSLDVDDAAALIDAAANLAAGGHHDAARRVLGLTAPGTALELVEILAR